MVTGLRPFSFPKGKIRYLPSYSLLRRLTCATRARRPSGALSESIEEVVKLDQQDGQTITTSSRNMGLPIASSCCSDRICVLSALYAASCSNRSVFMEPGGSITGQLQFLCRLLWPERVKKACKANKSFAIAHGHEEWYEGG